MASLVHFAFDTFPRTFPDASGSLLDVLVPFRIEGAALEGATIRAHVDGRPWTRTAVRRLSPEYVAGLRATQERDGMFDFTLLPQYLEMANRIGDGVGYVEARIEDVPAGSRVTYTLEAELADGTTVRSAEYAVLAVAPVFDAASVHTTHLPADGDPERAFVLMRVRDGRLDHVRIDVLCLQPAPDAPGADHERIAMAVTAGGRTLDLRSPGLTDLPLVDMGADAVVVSVPHDGGPPPVVSVDWNGGGRVDVDTGAPPAAGRARFMIVNFAIQGLNDYFTAPATTYVPARTFAQLTMRDERGAFSSRPGSRENGVGDGYGFTLDAHRRYGIPQLWAMNGGLITLLAQDCPDDLAAMRRDVEAGILEPVQTGFGAHRVPYYRQETNAAAIRLGQRAWAATVAPPAPVYYPDSRIYVQEPQVTEALRAGGVEWLVVDGFEFGDPGRPATVVRDAKPALGSVDADGRRVDGNHVWRDATTGLKVLFIDRRCKDLLLSGPDAEAERGKLTWAMRRRFLDAACRPVECRDNLFVYSDDADKASGNGWFDGVYDGSAPPMNKYYQAALSWLAAHPWVQVVRTADLAGEEPIGTLDLVRASDPFIEDSWRLPGVAPAAGQDHGLAFDTWYARWAATPVAWLGEDLRTISDRAERAVATCPVDNELVEIARLHLTMNLHESQWSKRARGDAQDAEDFVVAESIQLRDTHVWLHAAVWADWALGRPAPCTFRDDGPVVERVRAIEEGLDAAPPPWAGPDRGLHWDHDPLPTTVLYSERALVVLDRNGGRVTHLFALSGGRPVAVAGTFKARQWLDLDWATGTGRECDGIVLQNTVCTPGHPHVACDVEAAGATFGESPALDTGYDWAYPDNFNAYDAGPEPAGVTFTYGPATLDAPPDTLDELQTLLAQDRERKRAGERGHVWHDPERFGSFAKTVTLDGATVRVRYTGVRPGHLVANAFCGDLLAAVLDGERPAAAEAGDRAVVRTGATTVTVTLEGGCRFSGIEERVLTRDVRITAEEGAFAYRIDLPDAGR